MASVVALATHWGFMFAIHPIARALSFVYVGALVAVWLKAGSRPGQAAHAASGAAGVLAILGAVKLALGPIVSPFDPTIVAALVALLAGGAASWWSFVREALILRRPPIVSGACFLALGGLSAGVLALDPFAMALQFQGRHEMDREVDWTSVQAWVGEQSKRPEADTPRWSRPETPSGFPKGLPPSFASAMRIVPPSEDSSGFLLIACGGGHWHWRLIVGTPDLSERDIEGVEFSRTFRWRDGVFCTVE